VLKAGTWLERSRDLGLGFSSPAWQHSETLQKLSALPAESRIFSNSPDPVYLVTGRPAQALPRETELTTGLSNASYASELTGIRKQGGRGQHLVVYFRNLGRHTPAAERQLVRDLSLQVIARASDGAIYAIPTIP
jgi:hypothetical protein